jgi:signal transduction histidine kinase
VQSLPLPDPEVPDAAPRPMRGFAGSRPMRGFAALRVAAILVPALAAIAAGFVTWDRVEADASARIARTVDLLRENALRGFATQDAILVAIARSVAGRPPEALRYDGDVHGLLADLSASGAPLISGVLVTDAAARIVSASWEFPARPVDLSDRDYVRMLADPAAGRALGEQVASRPMGWPVIPVARRLPALPGPDLPRGLVISSFNPDVLETFFATVAEHSLDVIGLFRDDGAVLARHPATDDHAAPGLRPRITTMLDGLAASGQAAAWVVSAIDGRRRYALARRVGDWPAVIFYGADAEALRAAWRRRMVAPVAGGIGAMALLLALTALAERGARLRHERAEQRAEAEAQLARTGRVASLGLLAAGLAHDVKNLVQAVQSAARLMERRADDAAEIRHCARLLADTAARGGRLVDGMLAFARGGTDEDAPDQRLDIAAALRGLVDLLSRTLGPGWQVQATLAEDLPPARGDRAGFEAAVVNLAANARDAMPAGGVVAIGARGIVVPEGGAAGGPKPGHYVVTTVRDSGMGMDAATLQRIGEPFFTTKPPGIGTGLGLATVRGFCARAGGALLVESTPGQGTAASIWLPVA